MPKHYHLSVAWEDRLTAPPYQLVWPVAEPLLERLCELYKDSTPPGPQSALFWPCEATHCQLSAPDALPLRLTESRTE